MSLKGEVKQLIYEIANEMNLESCMELRSKLTLLVDPNLQVWYTYLYSWMTLKLIFTNVHHIRKRQFVIFYLWYQLLKEGENF